MSETSESKPKFSSGAKWDIVKYVLLRIGLVLVLTLLIQTIAILIGVPTFPILLSVLLALVVAFPLSMLLFRNLRAQVTKQLSEWDRGRQEYRGNLQKELEDRF